MGIGTHYVSAHAVMRLRERWEVARNMSKQALLESLACSIKSALDSCQQVRAPGGLYIPFTLGADEGFLVVKDDVVVTAVPKEWAPEVTRFLEEKNGQVREVGSDVSDDPARGPEEPQHELGDSPQRDRW